MKLAVAALFAAVSQSINLKVPINVPDEDSLEIESGDGEFFLMECLDVYIRWPTFMEVWNMG